MTCGPWPYVLPCAADELDAYPAELVEQQLAHATDLLWQATGRRYGLCTAYVRPCAAPEGQPVPHSVEWGSGGSVANVDGQWVNLPCWPAGCASVALQRVDLVALLPVAGIEQVSVDGIVLAPTAWRLDMGRWLTRVDGGAWPTRQRLDLPATESGTFEVVAQLGTEPGPALQAAVGTLLVELLLACSGDTKRCRLPAEVQQIVRRGVTYTFEPGGIGLPEVDRAVHLANPSADPFPSAVYSPDVRPPLVTAYAAPMGLVIDGGTPEGTGDNIIDGGTP